MWSFGPDTSTLIPAGRVVAYYAFFSWVWRRIRQGQRQKLDVAALGHGARRCAHCGIRRRVVAALDVHGDAPNETLVCSRPSTPGS